MSTLAGGHSDLSVYIMRVHKNKRRKIECSFLDWEKYAGISFKGCQKQGCAPSEDGKFVFLKLESCNLMSTFGSKFTAGDDE